MVDGTSPALDATDTYTVDVTISAPQCTPGEPSVCEADNATLQVCDAQGFFQDFACSPDPLGSNAAACPSATNGCAFPTADVCFDAIDLVDGDSITGDFANLNNDLDPGGGRYGSCTFDNFDSPRGPEGFYAVNLQQDEVLEVTMTSSTSSALLYLMQSCQDINTCLATAPSSSNVTLTYQATAPNETVYVVVDRTGFGTTGTYTLDVDVRQGLACAPGQAVCASGSAIEVCDASGQIATTYSCSPQNTGTCTGGACDADPAAASCGTAPDIGRGIVVYGDFGSGLTNDVAISSAASCVASDGDGNDLIYQATVGPNEVLSVDVQSLGRESFMAYLITDCADPDNTCRAGLEVGFSEDYRGALLYAPTTRETVKIVIDGRYSFSDESFIAKMEVLTRQCTSGQTQCASDGQTLQYCNSYGLFETYNCNGACTGGSCSMPSGDACVDALPLAPGQSFTGTFGNYTNRIDTGTGSCFGSTSTRPDGPEAVFAVSLNAGDILTADLTTSTSSAVMYVLDNCVASANAACLTSTYDDNVPQLEFFAPTTKTYYLVVDSTSASVTSNFTLDLSARQGGVCQPAGSSCDVSTGQLTICDALGTAIEATVSCPNGCADAQRCAPPATKPEACASAYALTASTRIVDSYGSYADDIKAGTGCGISDDNSDGNDAVYQVTLGANQYVQATVRAGNPFDDPTVYIVSDCAMPSMACLAGQNASDPIATAGYLSMAGETVYVVVDSDSNFDSDNYLLDVTIGTAVCSPGQISCPDATTLQTCNAFGTYDVTSCTFGCSQGACLPPPNDSCMGAIDATAGGTFVAPIEAYTNVYDPTAGGAASCTGQDAPGPDAIYALALRRGDFVSLTWSSPSDSSLWVTTDCSDAATAAASCFLGADASFGDPEQLGFVAPSAGTYYVIADVDSTSSLVNGNFQLDVIVQAGGLCSPGTAICADATTLQYCAQGGSAALSYICVGGCTGASCDKPTGEICADAIDATGGLRTTVDMDARSDDINLAPTGCLGEDTPGNDAVFRVDLTAGQAMVATVTPTSSGNAAIYLANDCQSLSDITNSTACLDGANLYGGGVAESVTYTATAGPETVYVVVDSSSTSSDSGVWDVDIVVGTPGACTPGQTMCLDANALGYCNAATTGYTRYACAGGCSGGACGMPTGDICIDALPLSPGQSFTGSFGDFTATLNPGVGSCYGSTSSQPDGPEAVFAVPLNAGDILTADLTTSTSSATMYVLDNCEQANQGACLISTYDDNVPRLDFYAPTTKTYYLVVDTTSTFVTTSTFTLDLSTRQGGVCQPGGSSCDMSTGQLTICDTLGTAVDTTISCPNGCSDTRRCAPPATPPENCSSAYSVNGPMRIVDTYGSYADNIQANGGCGISNLSDGPDAVYQVTLGANEYVQATVQAGNPFDDPTVYIVSDCTMPSTTCLDGRNTGDPLATASYLSAAGETVYIVIDSDSSSDSDAFLLDINIGTAVCQPGTFTPMCDSTGSGLLYCNDIGQQASYLCDGGCMNGACVNPTGDVCLDAIPAANGFTDSKTYEGTNELTASAGTHGACTFADSTPGIDHFYRVDLMAGQTVTASYGPPATGSASTLGLTYILTDCGDINSCVATTGSSSSSGMVTYTAPMAQTVWVVQDRTTPGNNLLGYGITISVQ